MAKAWLRPACSAFSAVVFVISAHAAQRPTDSEIAAAVKDCGIPPGGASLTFQKNRTFSVRGRDDLKYKQFMCLANWGEKRGFKTKIALIGQR